MASLGLEGPWLLDTETVNTVLTSATPGNYALGYTNDKGTFSVSRVGRSDNDLNARVHDYVGKYEQFKAKYATSAKAAFEKECENYHDFSPPDNKIHPDRPSGTNWKCPRCQQYE